jgi:hypothetical protein
VTFTKKPDGWFRAGDPDDDPFYLGLGLDDLEDRIETAILELGGDVEGPSDTLGNDFVGASSNNLLINHSTIIPVTCPSSGIVTIEVLVAGDQGGAGSTSLRGVVYDGASSGSLLLGSGVPAAVTQGDPLTWVTIAEDISVPSGVVYIGMHVGGSNGVATGRYNTGADGSSYFNTDTYADGSSATFGTPTSSTVDQCIRCTFTEIPPDFITGLTAYDSGVQTGETALITEIDFEGDDVTASATGGRLTVTVTGGTGGTGSGFTTTMLANYPIAANAVVESTPGTGGVTLVSGVGDQQIASASVLDTADGTTFRTRASDSAGTTTYRNTQTVTARLTKVQVVNGGTNQGDFEAQMSVA